MKDDKISLKNDQNLQVATNDSDTLESAQKIRKAIWEIMEELDKKISSMTDRELLNTPNFNTNLKPGINFILTIDTSKFYTDDKPIPTNDH